MIRTLKMIVFLFSFAVVYDLTPKFTAKPLLFPVVLIVAMAIRIFIVMRSKTPFPT